ncbi:MAG: TatD family hydrolase [Oscillospiraceae bacterium]|nr:TatD family hydrolase [Oscillospiraceae bacterium]
MSFDKKTTAENGKNGNVAQQIAQYNSPPYKNIFDAHAHYDDERFDDDRYELFAALPQCGVCGILNNGTDIETSKTVVDFAKKHEILYAAVGYHPTCLQGVPDDYLAQLEELCRCSKTVAVGEIGLDYHYDDPKELQQKVFVQQLDFAKQMHLPVIVHDRDAHGDMLQILKQEKPNGIVHCFSGSEEMLREVLKIGMHITLGGVVTFKNAVNPVKIAAAVPLDRLLLETDAPYLAPAPFRGKRCVSTMIAKTAEKIAEIKGIAPQELIDITTENAKRIFKI